MNIGEEFEEDLARELGFSRVAGSGNKWYSKLDVRGRGTRWSLKATEKDGFRIDRKMLDEALSATEGIGGTGETPIWAVRIPAGDFVIMRKEDWIRMIKEEGLSLPQTKTEERRSRANIPQLMRMDSTE